MENHKKERPDVLDGHTVHMKLELLKHSKTKFASLETNMLIEKAKSINELIGKCWFEKHHRQTTAKTSIEL